MIEKQESRRIRAEIGNVLIDIWDPIGVKNVPEARDEYDRYIFKVYGMLITGATDEEIAAELIRIQIERMEIQPQGSNISRTIAALRAIALPPHSK